MRQIRPAVFAGAIDGHVGHPLEEALDAFGVPLAFGDEALDGRAGRLLEFVVRHLPARHRDDAAGADALPRAVAPAARRQQIAEGEVAGAPAADHPRSTEQRVRKACASAESTRWTA